MSVWVCSLIVLFGIPLISSIYLRTSGIMVSDKLFIGLIVGLSIAYGLVLFGLIFYFNARLAKMRGKLANQNLAQVTTDFEPLEYRTKSSFLGLPLIHVHRGGYSKGKHKSATAKGWIAIGDIAISPLFAAGSICIAPIAFGAMAFGGMAFGGLALGGIAAGGFAAGWLGIGGFALGYQAIGGLTFGWKAAFGGIAVAHEFAVGGIAQALEANTPIANEWFQSSPYLKHVIFNVQHRPWIWFVLGFSPLVVIGLANTYKKLFPKTSEMPTSDDQWVIECPKCHTAFPLELAGGFRYKASSFEKRTLGFCRSCTRFRWMRIRFFKKP